MKKKKQPTKKEVVTKKTKKKATESAGELAERYPWKTEYGDHFETPEIAYRHISPILERMGGTVGGTVVYDPYYCRGATKRRLGKFGFTVKNPKQDFYTSEAPGFDILCANPPYSGTHKEKILAFAEASRKPWALLLPAYCAEKSYFPRWSGKGRVFALKPRGGYAFDHPHGAGKDKETPFQAVWFVGGVAPDFLDGLPPQDDVVICRSLEDLVAARAIRGTKRPNPRTRKKRQLRRTTAPKESPS
mmetsp:Transcript_33209/g.106021  ORF Transcript_33209/g.106021 Transcript_33209/m.106021 type:complete len:246 (-) Transcript_33209:35-772(-)